MAPFPWTREGARTRAPARRRCRTARSAVTQSLQVFRSRRAPAETLRRWFMLLARSTPNLLPSARSAARRDSCRRDIGKTADDAAHARRRDATRVAHLRTSITESSGKSSTAPDPALARGRWYCGDVARSLLRTAGSTRAWTATFVVRARSGRSSLSLRSASWTRGPADSTPCTPGFAARSTPSTSPCSKRAPALRSTCPTSPPPARRSRRRGRAAPRPAHPGGVTTEDRWSRTPPDHPRSRDVTVRLFSTRHAAVRRAGPLRHPR